MFFRHATDIQRDSAISLNRAKVGCDVTIEVMEGPGCERLRDLGFCEQMRLRKLSNGRNVLCSLCGSKLAISSELAKQVLVRPVAVS